MRVIDPKTGEVTREFAPKLERLQDKMMNQTTGRWPARCHRSAFWKWHTSPAPGYYHDPAKPKDRELIKHLAAEAEKTATG